MSRRLSAGLSLLLLLGGCQGKTDHDHPHPHPHVEAEPWSVTAWGERYEIFDEVQALVAGSPAESHTHVTLLDGFQPLREGRVTMILRAADGGESFFSADRPVRDGIFKLAVNAPQPGDYALFYRIESAAGPEEIPAGRVQVGTPDHPGGLVAGPAAPAPPDSTIAPAGEPVPFLKEQQWRTRFATAWSTEARLERGARGVARLRPAAGRELMLSAPLDGTVLLRGAAHVGRRVHAGELLVELTPRASSSRTLAGLRAELETGRARLARLESLLAQGAASLAEVDAARTHVHLLEAESGALTGGGSTVSVTAPWAGEVAELMVLPGQAVTAGEPLLRLFATDPVWVEVDLAPGDADLLAPGPAELVLHLPGRAEPTLLSGEGVRLITAASQVRPGTGTVTVLFEVPGRPELRPGLVVDAEVTLPGASEGVVLPASSVVDDGGVPILYVQESGESFSRVEIGVEARHGSRIAVRGLGAGRRVVTEGGASIRRAALLQTGPVEGHVH